MFKAYRIFDGDILPSQGEVPVPSSGGHSFGML